MPRAARKPGQTLFMPALCRMMTRNIADLKKIFRRRVTARMKSSVQMIRHSRVNLHSLHRLNRRTARRMFLIPLGLMTADNR